MGQSNTDERRGTGRHAVNLPNEVVWNEQRTACRLVNVSEHGALLEAELGATLGDDVEVELPGGGNMLGKVVRITKAHIALSFPGALLVAPILEQAGAA